jgi:hypothetical protein
MDSTDNSINNRRHPRATLDFHPAHLFGPLPLDDRWIFGLAPSAQGHGTIPAHHGLELDRRGDQTSLEIKAAPPAAVPAFGRSVLPHALNLAWRIGSGQAAGLTVVARRTIRTAPV